jgi:hypothetical protein
MSDRTTTGILAIQRAIVSASPSGWRDGLVTSAGNGIVEVATLTGELRSVVTDAPVNAGDPVALHLVGEVLAAGPDWYSAR